MLTHAHYKKERRRYTITHLSNATASSCTFHQYLNKHQMYIHSFFITSMCLFSFASIATTAAKADCVQPMSKRNCNSSIDFRLKFFLFVQMHYQITDTEGQSDFGYFHGLFSKYSLFDSRRLIECICLFNKISINSFWIASQCRFFLLQTAVPKHSSCDGQFVDTMHTYRNGCRFHSLALIFATYFSFISFAYMVNTTDINILSRLRLCIPNTTGAPFHFSSAPRF